MSKYNHRNRQIGQTDKEGLELVAFMGPVELWKTSDNSRFSVYMFLVPDPVYEVAARKSLNVKRFVIDRAREDIEELFSAACELVSYLPSGHPLNSYFYPIS